MAAETIDQYRLGEAERAIETKADLDDLKRIERKLDQVVRWLMGAIGTVMASTVAYAFITFELLGRH